MSHPYRDPARLDDEPGSDPEARIAYALLAVLGVARLAVALALGEQLGGEATIAAAMVAVAAWGTWRS